MKHIRKSLLSFFALVLLVSCARVPQQGVSEKLPTLTPELAAEKGKASVVRITGGNLMKMGAGSGFFVQPDKIVTNLHVIARPGPIFAKLSDDDTIWMVEGVTAYDIENDLVVLKIAGEGAPISLGSSDTARKGETVYAIGYPGGGEYKLTEGTIRSSRYRDKWLQTTADISKGNSGGPMLNGKGEVIGISTAVDSSFSYAVPSNLLKTLLSQPAQVEPLVDWYKQKRIRAYGHLQRGEDNYNGNDYKAALTDLNGAVEADPEFTDAYATRGNVAVHYGESMAKYGSITQARQHYHVAIADYTEAIRLDPEDDANYNGRGHTRCHYGEYEAKRRNPTAAQKQYEAAIEDYTKAIKLDSDDDRNYTGRGWAKSLLGALNAEQAEFDKAQKQYQAAIKDCTKAIKLQPEEDTNYSERGWVKFRLGALRTKQGKTVEARKQYQAAIMDSEKAIQLDPDEAFDYHTRGVAKAALGDYNGAIDDLDVAIEHSRDYTEAYHSRGKAKRALGQHDAAKTDFERALQSRGRGDVTTQELERASTEMVRIPAGEFQMGSNEITEATPRHTVYLDAFYIDPYEVTNAQFKAFIDANPEWRKDNIPSEYHDGNYLKHWDGNDYANWQAHYPVVYVSWYAAMAYAKWVGKRLPTEAEWERAARGGVAHKRYVWGNSRDPGRANYGYYGKYTRNVGSYLPNGYGLHDMGGNVWELCLDEYNKNFYRRSPKENPVAGVSDIKALMEDFTSVQTVRVSRGGSWNTRNSPAQAASRGNDTPTNTNSWLGFRCAKSAPPQQDAEANPSSDTAE
ncbi:MAG: SUMF1/EgtB/PvdO family nonheme iron enzyme [Candidatus Poribacteria bacterium]|nr:SUMF1/EgtB/PvdO family nonheme iron enzyme [Candidatus Poribacteria bacterium]